MIVTAPLKMSVKMAAQKNILTQRDNMTAYGQECFFTASITHPTALQ